MMLSAEQKEKIDQYVLSVYPKEAVIGIRENELIFLENMAENPENEFKLSDTDSLRLFRENFDSLIHSHPNSPPCPSESDMVGQVNSGIPWGILSTEGESCSDIIWFGDQLSRMPLVGRPFIHGVADCYSLIRDYYLLEKGIKLKDYPRNWEWWKEKNLYEEKFADAGFVEVHGTPQEGDVFLAKIKSERYNHGGIYLGSELVLHHLTANSPVDASRLSKREPINRWMNMIKIWLRYTE